ncbi:MAG: acyloxyacyl hydrolase [Opitutales bacterium]|nr:acyloxyacyl hydrolase [Opitutales bacterium]MCH8540168.1 acyloxyacyl hydrolase [Opitutales bacterium]
MKLRPTLLVLCGAILWTASTASAFSPDQLGFRLGAEADEPIRVRSAEVFLLTEPFYEQSFDPPYGQLSLDAAAVVGVLRAEGDWSIMARLGPGVNWIEPFHFPVVLRLDVSPTLMSQESLAGRKIGGIFHFTSGFQIDWKISEKKSLHYRIQHTSNAGFRRPNPGLDLHFIGYSRKL